MSYQEGWAAINLEMPDKIPRTEYSADRHWKLVEDHLAPKYNQIIKDIDTHIQQREIDIDERAYPP